MVINVIDIPFENNNLNFDRDNKFNIKIKTKKQYHNPWTSCTNGLSPLAAKLDVIRVWAAKNDWVKRPTASRSSKGVWIDAVKNSHMSLIVANAIWPGTFSLLIAGAVRDWSDVTAARSLVNWLSSMANVLFIISVVQFLVVRVMGFDFVSSKNYGSSNIQNYNVVV